MEQPMDAKTIAEARERLRAKLGAQQRGKKGTVRMAPRVVSGEKKNETDRIKQALKKFNLQSLGPVEEVVLHKADHTAMHFQNPRVNIDVRQNVTAITGNYQVKESQNVNELLQKWREQMVFQQQQQQLQQEDEAIPDLVEVEDFEAVATGAAPEKETDEAQRKLEEVD